MKKSTIYLFFSLLFILLTILATIRTNYWAALFSLLFVGFTFFLSFSNKKRAAEKRAAELKKREDRKRQEEEQSTQPTPVLTDSFFLAGSDYLPIQSIQTVLSAMSDPVALSAYQTIDQEELRHRHQRLYKYGAFKSQDVRLEVESFNQGKQIAIAVLIAEVAIGYLPEEAIAHLTPYLDQKKYTYQLFGTIKGGPYKYFDNEKRKTLLQSEPILFHIDLAVYSFSSDKHER